MDRPVARLLRARLVLQQDRLAQLDGLDREPPKLNPGWDLADAAQQWQDHEGRLGDRARAQEEIQALTAALDRIAAGTYGVCEGCAGPIPAKRLRAHPTARRCLGCQVAAERPRRFSNGYEERAHDVSQVPPPDEAR